jgi:hypothetical protein
MSRPSFLVTTLALLVLAPAARAADGKDPPKEKESWLLATDEDLPDPPLVHAQGGVILWPYLRTDITIGRRRALKGRAIDDAEDKAGLPARWVSPFFEATVGTTIRGGFAWLDVDRQGDFTRVEETIDVGRGQILARPGDFLSVGFHYSQVDAYAQWDVFRSTRMKINLVGGARVLRISTRLAGIQPATTDYQSIAVNDWVVSPVVGGGVELEPVPSFTVFSSVRFIDWAWSRIHLREERAFEVHLGCAVTFIEDMLSGAIDFRFLSVLVNPSENGGKILARHEFDAGGVGLSVLFRY